MTGRLRGSGVQSLGVRGSGGSRAQTLATLTTASLENSAAGAVRHAVAKTMPAGAATIIGLERTLHEKPPDSDEMAVHSGAAFNSYMSCRPRRNGRHKAD
jgi:hypothetical protein